MCRWNAAEVGVDQYRANETDSGCGVGQSYGVGTTLCTGLASRIVVGSWGGVATTMASIRGSCRRSSGNTSRITGNTDLFPVVVPYQAAVLPLVEYTAFGDTLVGRTHETEAFGNSLLSPVSGN